MPLGYVLRARNISSWNARVGVPTADEAECVKQRLQIVIVFLLESLFVVLATLEQGEGGEGKEALQKSSEYCLI